MTLGQLHGVAVLVLAALPLGAIALVTGLYGALALRRVPAEAADSFERSLAVPYCWAMSAVLLLAAILVGGWTERIWLAVVAGVFFAAIHEFLPRMRALAEGRPPEKPSRLPGIKVGLPAARQIAAAVSLAQFLVVLVVFVRLVT